MNNSTLFDTSYQRRKWELLEQLLEQLGGDLHLGRDRRAAHRRG